MTVLAVHCSWRKYFMSNDIVNDDDWLLGGKKYKTWHTISFTVLQLLSFFASLFLWGARDKKLIAAINYFFADGLLWRSFHLEILFHSSVGQVPKFCLFYWSRLLALYYNVVAVTLSNVKTSWSLQGGWLSCRRLLACCWWRLDLCPKTDQKCKWKRKRQGRRKWNSRDVI